MNSLAFERQSEARFSNGLKNPVGLARAVADFLGMLADAVEHRAVEIGHWRFVVHLDVLARVDRAAAADVREIGDNKARNNPIKING